MTLFYRCSPSITNQLHQLGSASVEQRSLVAEGASTQNSQYSRLATTAVASQTHFVGHYSTTIAVQLMAVVVVVEQFVVRPELDFVKAVKAIARVSLLTKRLPSSGCLTQAIARSDFG